MDLFPDATFICFEPLPVAFQRLEARASSQRRVTAINVALGERNGRATIHLHSEHSPSSSLLPSTALTKALFPFTEKQRDLDVPMMTLDAAMDALEWPLNDEIFIKMDVQGYEHRVIKGGPRSLRRCCACMLEVSLDQLYVGQPSFEELICQMKDLGFRYYGTVNQRAAADGHVVYADVMFLNQERDAAKAKTKHVGL
jgi:FkbM family methyltransferase